MMTIAEWFDANGYEPTRYKYTQRREAVFVTVDLPSVVAANAFAMHFGGGGLPSRNGGLSVPAIKGGLALGAAHRLIVPTQKRTPA
jgi:hypothetical protein